MTGATMLRYALGLEEAPLGAVSIAGESWATNLLQSAEWQGLDAVKRGRVYVADGNLYFNRSSCGVVETAEMVAEMARPDLKGLWGHHGKHWVALDELDDGTRVWEVPGSDFASYRWGNTVDPITPGLMDRGYVARELVPFGSAESAALLTAVDRRLQEDSLEAAAIAPIEPMPR